MPVGDVVTSHAEHRSASPGNRLQRSVTCRLNEWRNGQWNDAPERLDSEDRPDVMEDDRNGVTSSDSFASPACVGRTV